MANSSPSNKSASSATPTPKRREPCGEARGPSHDQWFVWRRAVEQTSVDQAVADLYVRLDEAVAARGPTCWVSGRCCQFDTFGHRLYVTGLEIAWVLRRSLNSITTSAVMDSCVFQTNGLCSIHTIRPMGCRVFFCQQGTQDWQHALYETFLSELRQLHEAHGLPYRYLEWRAGLAEALKSSAARNTDNTSRG